MRSPPVGIFCDYKHGLMIRFENNRERKATDAERATMLAALRTEAQPTGVAQTAWRPFHPNDWHLSGFCYPCIVVAPDGEVGTPCDPWTLPPDNDWTGWLCCALPDDYPARLSNQGVSK